MSNVRLAPIDAMKGFATFLVIMGHVLCLSFEACDSVVFEVLSMVHMPIFVMLSGYFSTKALPLSCRGIANYWWAKVLRLLLPLVAIPVLFQYCKFGMLGLPTVALLNGYWFTYALFIMFVPFFVFRLVTDLAKRRAAQTYHFYIDLVVALLSILVVELVFLSFQGSWDSRLQGQEVSWLYKYLVLGYFVGSYGGGGIAP